MKHNNMLRCHVHLMAAFLIVFLVSACAVSPPPASAPARMSGHVVNVRHYLPVRVAPSLIAAETGRLLPGEGVYVNQDNGEWCTIESMRLENGQPMAGWVLRQYIMVDSGPAVAPGGPSGPSGPPGPGGPSGTEGPSSGPANSPGPGGRPSGMGM